MEELREGEGEGEEHKTKATKMRNEKKKEGN